MRSFRCLFALPPLFALMWWEDRRWGSRDAEPAALGRGSPALFFAADLLFWHHAILFVGGPGLATVLSNTQVVLVAVLRVAHLA